jgi:hypothetical protein
MRIIRSKPAAGKPRKIICAGCGKRAAEAGVAALHSAVEEGYGPDPDRLIMVIEEDEMLQPLCESCVTALLRDET